MAQRPEREPLHRKYQADGQNTVEKTLDGAPRDNYEINLNLHIIIEVERLIIVEIRQAVRKLSNYKAPEPRNLRKKMADILIINVWKNKQKPKD